MIGWKLSHVSKRGPRSSARMPLTGYGALLCMILGILCRQDTDTFSMNDLCNLNVEKWLTTMIASARSLAFAFCWLGSSGEQPTSVPYFSWLALNGAEGCWNAVTKKWWKLQIHFHVSKQKSNTYWVRSWRRILIPQFQKFTDGAYVIVRRAGLLWSQQDFEWWWSVP